MQSYFEKILIKNEPFLLYYRFKWYGGKIMQDILDLIREAKPLYHARKKRKQQIKIGLATLACVAFVWNFTSQEHVVDDLSWWDLGENEALLTDVEYSGLPLDDYGLLWVG